MYLEEGIVEFKEEKKRQKLLIKENKKLIKDFNHLLDTILKKYNKSNVNQTFVYEMDNEIYYIRKINKYKKSYYSVQKLNKENIIDYKFEYFYGNALINTTSGMQKINKFYITNDTLELLLFDFNLIFKDDEKINSLIKKINIK